MSESKSPKGNDTEGIDELSSLRAQHVLSASSTMDSVARARDRLDEESKLRSGIRRERRMRIAEMTERVSGMHGAIRKANEILFEEQLQNIEADLTIIQSGTDCLAGDPQSKMKLSNNIYWHLLSELKELSQKTLILGGGGYNPFITAKAWAGNWLVLNNNEHLLNLDLNKECRKLLRSLKWDNIRVKNGIPEKWLCSWRDPQEKNIVRYEILKLIDDILEYKK